MFYTFIDIFLDALKDSALTLPVLFICYLLIELLEEKIFSKYKKNKFLKAKFAPIISAGFGIIPQCGFSVVASELYSKRSITIGSLFAILIATSDEALPILLSKPSSYISLIIIILIKFLYAIIIGLSLDFIFRKLKKVSLSSNKGNIQNKDLKTDTYKIENYNVTTNNDNKDINDKDCINDKIVTELEDVHGCCRHSFDHKHDSKLRQLFVHPLIHSIKIFVFILVINIIFGCFVEFVGEDVIASFMLSTGFFEPIIVSVVGLIPNCAASVIITELFLSGSISIGSCLAGLCVNSGLALVMLFKFNKNIKENLGIVGLLYVLSCVLGLIINLF